MRFACLGLSVLLLMVTTGAQAESSLADIKAKLLAKSSEMDQVDKMLADPVKNNRIAAMQVLLGSGNPIFVKRAKEIGLFSSDPDLQAAALAAVFESGGPFRLITDLTSADEEKSLVKNWLSRYRGSWDEAGKVGQISFMLDPYNAKLKCWPLANTNDCGVILSGANVSIDGWAGAGGNLSLEGTGELTGSFRVDNSVVSVPARIPLAE